MKIMIASDIHGSAYYCRKMLDAFGREKADKLLLLGDILYHGPRNDLPREYAPKSVIEQLNAVKGSLLCVRGNCEAQVDQMVLQFPVLADYCILYIGSRMVFATHGHLYNSENMPFMQKGDIYLQGHTHIPECRDNGFYLHLNPGSVSIPKQNSEHSYMIMTESGFEWKTLDGEVYKRYTLGGEEK